MEKIRASAWLLKITWVNAKRKLKISTCQVIGNQHIKDRDLCNGFIESLSNLGNSYIQEIKLPLSQRNT